MCEIDRSYWHWLVVWCFCSNSYCYCDEHGRDTTRSRPAGNSSFSAPEFSSWSCSPVRDYILRIFPRRMGRTPQSLASTNSAAWYLTWLSIFIGRILRLLATEHIFKEVAPDVFANNRISSVVDTYKSVVEINAKYVSLVKVVLCFVLTSFLYSVPKTSTVELLDQQH